MQIRILYIIVLLLIGIGNVKGQFVEKDKFLRHVDSVNLELKTIKKEVDLGNKALEVSELYSAKADELVDKTLSSLGIIIGLTGFGLGVGITYFAGFYLNRKKSELDRQYLSYKEKVDRLIQTEGETIDLKKSSKVYFVSRVHSNALSHLQAIIKKEYGNNQYLNKSFAEAIAVIQQEDYLYKVIIIDDKELPATAYDANNEGWMKIKENIQALISNDIGMIIYSNMRIPDMGMKYSGFASKPYSFYTNLNNLIKFMWIDKKGTI